MYISPVGSMNMGTMKDAANKTIQAIGMPITQDRIVLRMAPASIARH
jgi:hypothetical protein